MSVYVDPLIACIPNKYWRCNRSCHMFADTEEELHEVAESLRLKRSWFQSGRFPHYDLTPNKRMRAVKQGVVALGRREAVMMWREKGWSKIKGKT